MTEENGSSNKALLADQIQDLDIRTKRALESKQHSLTFALIKEYGGLIQSALNYADEELGKQIDRLGIETLICPINPNDPLARLRVLDNSVQRLKTLVRRLLPASMRSELLLHPKVVNASERLLQDGHFAPAIFEAFKALEEYVKEKSEVRDEIGKKLMAKVFSEDSPILQVKPSKPNTLEEEQEGFKFIFMGTMLAIRNPKAHYAIEQSDREKALEYLALASLLFRVVDDTSKV